MVSKPNGRRAAKRARNKRQHLFHPRPNLSSDPLGFKSAPAPRRPPYTYEDPTPIRRSANPSHISAPNALNKLQKFTRHSPDCDGTKAEADAKMARRAKIVFIILNISYWWEWLSWLACKWKRLVSRQVFCSLLFGARKRTWE